MFFPTVLFHKDKACHVKPNIRKNCIQSKYRKIRIRNNSVFGHFSCSVSALSISESCIKLKKVNLKFFITFLCTASKGQAPQRSVKIKTKLYFFLCLGLGWESLGKSIKYFHGLWFLLNSAIKIKAFVVNYNTLP